MLKSGDVLINSTGEGTAGRVAQLWNIPSQTTVDGHMIILRPTSEVDTLYYGYAIKAQQFMIESLAEGSTGQTEINRKRLQEEITISYPKDKKKQHSIAKILEEIDKKIEVNNQINRNLSDQAESLFQSWFVDYEHFGGVCPEDWKEGVLEDVVDFYNGYAFKSNELLDVPDHDNECYHVFKQGHIRRGGGFNISGTRSWFLKKNAEKLNKYVLHKGDILMAMTDMKNNVAILGNTAVMEMDDTYIKPACSITKNNW